MNKINRWKRNSYGGKGRLMKAVSISLPPDLFHDIEADRGKTSRSAYITQKLKEALQNEQI